MKYINSCLQLSVIMLLIILTSNLLKGPAIFFDNLDNSFLVFVLFSIAIGLRKINKLEKQLIEQNQDKK